MTASMSGDPETRSTLEAVRRFNEAFDRHDADGVMAAMTEDCVFENTSRPESGLYQRSYFSGALIASSSSVLSSFLLFRDQLPTHFLKVSRFALLCASALPR